MANFVKILGTDGENEAIVNSDNALKVFGDITVTPGTASGDPADTVLGALKLSGSDDLIVDGSTTPQVFTFDGDPSASVDMAVEEIRFLMVTKHIDPGGAYFGPLPALANGLLLEIVSNGVTTQVANFKVTEDFMRIARRHSAPINRSGVNDTLTAVYEFRDAILKGGVSDLIRLTVRDDLTPKLLHFSCSVIAIKVTP